MDASSETLEIIELSSLPNDQATALVATGAPVYLLVNPVEYHGPHLPLDNDTLLSMGSIKALHTEMRKRGHRWPLLIYSVLRMGCGAVPTHGTTNHHYSAVTNAVMEACKGIASLGAKKAGLITFHGFPFHNLALEKGARWLRARGIPTIAPFHVIMEQLLVYEPGMYSAAVATIADPVLRKQYDDHLPEDFHAGFFETSLCLHWNPQTVSPDWQKVPPCPPYQRGFILGPMVRLLRALGLHRLACELDFIALGVAWTRIHPTPGYTGYPGLANAKAGELFAREITRKYADLAEAVWLKGEKAPQPIHRWLGPVSLGGVLAPK